MRWQSLVTFLFLLALTADVGAQRARPEPGREPEKSYRDVVERYEQQRLEFQRAETVRRLTADAKANDSGLERTTLRDAKAWIDGLTPEEFRAHLQGLRRAGSSSEALKIALPDGIEKARAIYISEMEKRIDAYTAQWVKELRAADAKQLLAFVRRQGSDATLESVPPRMADAWFESLGADRARLTHVFPLLDGSSREMPRIADLADVQYAGYGEISDHELGYRHRALDAYVRSSPALSNIALKRWRFHPPQIESVWRVLRAAEKPLPGGRPEVVYFLDRVMAHDAIAELDAGWGTQKRSSRLLDHSDVDRFLAEFVDKTVILIGHIEGRHFVMERGPGREALALDLPNLLIRAQQQRVTLVPIGCNSADAGAYLGFTRPISASQVADLLRAIPDRPMAIWELLAAFDRIGQVTLDAGRLAEFLEVTVGEGREDQEQGVAITIVRFPASLLQGENFATYFQRWEHENRPLTDRGLARWWRTTVREAPWKFFLYAIVLFLALSAWDWVRQNIVLRRGVISRGEYVAQKVVAWAAAMLFLVGAVSCALKLWPLLLMIAVFMALVFLGSLILHYLGYGYEK
ncbi:hypothetical protein [Lysobacter terrae]